MMEIRVDYTKILNLEPMEPIRWLSENFPVAMPVQIVNCEDMEKSSSLLLRLSSYYSYLCTLLSYAKVMTKDAKRNKEKEEYEV